MGDQGDSSASAQPSHENISMANVRDKETAERPTEQPAENNAQAKAKERMERFKALKARAKNSAERNLKDAAAESQRLATDPKLLTSLSRKQAIASHNLLKADTEASGEDFERKRAWDWTVEESEKWDRRMEKKQRHRGQVAFQDYRQEANKVYKRQLREMKPDVSSYDKQKTDAVRKAAQTGGLEVVETEDGELVAIDQDGTFYSTADSTDFTQNKPDKAAVDRLVNEMRKAEEVQMKKRRDRGRGDDDGDVTFINEKNKQFNLKLGRFYNKYTADIRDSFERGTAM
ncbi:SYF2-domain-containing protein [Xylona heveae TC161]|uniref:Pre-mRNA-splicing factor SYF2 n=1 Tax=Xylona heveae (strain CBS 132557 / TC161) TaxID=1328760 RepID=A0A165G4Q1_XYLHT|nr:SYF2-domain-containing protein [Xylona heveae TC161]KZF21736.1 SYF2-domain-containing protein [Xylona heveae TC161]